MTKKQWVTYQHQLPVTTPHCFPGSDTEFPPCSGFRIGHHSAETSRRQHSAAQTCWVQSTPCLRGCRLNKDHQLSPNSVPDIVENPFPMKKWRLPQDHLFYNFKIATKSHHFMNETWVPETCPHLPTWMSSGAGYRVHVYLLPPNPAGASFRFSFSLKPQCLCPPSKGSLTHDLTWQP